MNIPFIFIYFFKIFLFVFFYLLNFIFIKFLILNYVQSIVKKSYDIKRIYQIEFFLDFQSQLFAIKIYILLK